MPRTIGGGRTVAAARVVTDPGYLLQFNLDDGIQRMSNLGDIDWNGAIWPGVDFMISGLTWQPDQDITATLTIQNLDSVASNEFLNEQLSDVLVDIYEFDAGQVGPDDVPKIAQLAIDKCRAGLKNVTIALLGQSSLTLWCPRQTIDAANGFKFAMPAGTQIPWGQEIFVIEEDDSVD